MLNIDKEDILDTFHDGQCVLISKSNQILDLIIGSKIVINGKESSIKNIKHGKDRILLSIDEKGG